MRLHLLDRQAGKVSRRVGRGESSGRGKTSGRGNTGARSRSGYHASPVTSGIPWYRKLPKRGFSNARCRIRPVVVSLERLLRATEATVGLDWLLSHGLIASKNVRVKVIGGGDGLKAMTVEAHGFSVGAKRAIEAAGGQAIVL